MTAPALFQRLTSSGPAAIAVVRIAGAESATFLDRHVRASAALASWGAGRVLRAALLDDTGAEIDDILVSVHRPAPDWDLRLHLHGSPWIVGRCEALAAACGLVESDADSRSIWDDGARILTEACVLAPRITTAAGVRWLMRQTRLLPEALARLLAEVDRDETEEALRQIAKRQAIARRFSCPARIAIVGPPNAGKSTLLNALADQPLSLVSQTAGTTRDWVEAPGELAGFPVTWTDTAGLRASRDPLEREGIVRTRAITAESDAVVWLVDLTGDVGGDLDRLQQALGAGPSCIALNKSDLRPDFSDAVAAARRFSGVALAISAARADGLVALQDAIRRSLAQCVVQDLAAPAAFTARQAACLERAANEPRSRAAHVRACLGMDTES